MHTMKVSCLNGRAVFNGSLLIIPTRRLRVPLLGESASAPFATANDVSGDGRRHHGVSCYLTRTVK